MEKEIQDYRKYYLKEFQFFDGDNDITFNIVDIDFDNRRINIAITDCGKISVREFDLRKDEDGNYYFNYGIMFNEIYVDDFETIKY